MLYPLCRLESKARVVLYRIRVLLCLIRVLCYILSGCLRILTCKRLQKVFYSALIYYKTDGNVCVTREVILNVLKVRKSLKIC